ncbi:MAG: hypothetical protein QM739_04020 [Propionivibrio sp.]
MSNSTAAHAATPSVSEPWSASRLVFALLIVFALFCASPAVADDVYMTGIDLHSLGRLVFGEIKRASYEIPDELADLRRVSVKWLDVANTDVVTLYRRLLEKQGYTVEFRQGLYEVVTHTPKSQIYTAKNRKLTDILDMMAGFPGVSVRSAASGLPGSAVEKTGDLIKAGEDRALESVVLSGYPDALAAWTVEAEKLDVSPESVQVRAAVFEVTLSDSDSSSIGLAGQLLRTNTDLSFGAQTSAGTFTFGIGGLSLTIKSLLADQRFKLISQPHLSVVSGQAARLAVGQKLPILTEKTTTDGGRESQSVKYVDAGVVLDVKPTKRGDQWELDIGQELSSVQTASGVAGNPIFSNRTVKSRLLTRLGEVNVLAGLDTAEQSKSTERNLFIDLFRGQEKSGARSQILLLIELQEPESGEEQKANIEDQRRQIDASVSDPL